LQDDADNKATVVKVNTTVFIYNFFMSCFKLKL
jgi:hypothetical protein